MSHGPPPQDLVPVLFPGPKAPATRLVVVDFTFRAAVAVPQDWTLENIHFHYNDGTYCAANVVLALAEVTAGSPGCLCPSMAAIYVGEHTP